jgi:hypothetical protein
LDDGDSGSWNVQANSYYGEEKLTRNFSLNLKDQSNKKGEILDFYKTGRYKNNDFFLAIVPKHACFERGNIAGSDLARKGVSKESATECQQFCEKNSQCHFWTFNNIGKHCYAKKRAIYWLGQYNADMHNTVSGPKRCCVSRGKGVVAGNATTFGNGNIAQTFMECQQKCQSNQQCKFFFFNGARCFLKTAKTAEFDKNGGIWGPKQCPETGKYMHRQTIYIVLLGTVDGVD